MERYEDIRDPAGCDDDGSGNRPGHRSGLRVTIHVEPEPPERQDQQPIEWIWHPVAAGKLDYNPYGLLPESHRIFVQATKDN